MTLAESSTGNAALVERARAALAAGALGDLVFDMTSIPSPTGEELALARFVAGHLGRVGLEARAQVVGGRLASTIGRLRGTGGGPTVLLYAPLDTAWAGRTAEDEPWLGAVPRPDFALPPRREGRKVIGLGAENPKAFAACAIGALEALAIAGARLAGDVVVVLAGGSMPVNARPGIDRAVVGHGSGIRAVLESEPRPDFAVVLKPGYAVSHEEVGLAWFRLTVKGAVNYTGIRHKGPYRNPIVVAARLVTALEAWLPAFTDANRSGLVAPQGSVNAIRAGSPERAAFVPATCQLDLDLRVAPGSSPELVRAQLESALADIRASDPEVDVDVEMTAALPGTRTDPASPIVRALVEAWEAREGRQHVPVGNASGASDAAILRSHGIPTARIGLPPPTTPSPYPGFSMGVADIDSMQRLTEVLVDTVVRVAGATRNKNGPG